MKSLRWLGLLGVVSSLAASEPNHLEPLSMFSREEEYLRPIKETLVGQDSVYWMIVLPSFSPRYAVVLRGWYARAVGAKRVPLIVEVVTDGSGPNGEVGQLSRVSKPLGAEEVDLLAGASLAALMRVRYPERPVTGLDGELYFFSFDGKSGRTWSPESGEARSMVDAWSALADYARAHDGKSEIEALRRFRGSCAQIAKLPR